MKRLQAFVCVVFLCAAPALAHPIKSESRQQFEFGVSMAKKGSWREAAFRFERSVRGDPNNPLAHNNLGVALESIGEFDRALASYKRALDLDPKNEKIRENLDRLEAYLASRSAPAKPPATAPSSGSEPAKKPGGGDGL